MTYHVRFSEEAKRDLKEFRSYTSSIIVGWIKKHLEDSQDPRGNGKGLSSLNNEQWRYRVGNYTIIAEIQDDTKTVLVLKVNHRSNIYLNNR